MKKDLINQINNLLDHPDLQEVIITVKSENGTQSTHEFNMVSLKRHSHYFCESDLLKDKTLPVEE